MVGVLMGEGGYVKSKSGNRLKCNDTSISMENHPLLSSLAWELFLFTVLFPENPWNICQHF